MEASTRAEARAKGLDKYFTGKPCKHGHVAARFVYGNCTACMREQARARYLANPEKHLEKGRRWAKKNPSRIRDYRRKANGLPSPTRMCPELCECCGELPAKYLDHDHETGEFRGWLCNGCNLSIGRLGDSRMGVMRAVTYFDFVETQRAGRPVSIH